MTRALLKSKADIEDALCRIETRMEEQKRITGEVGLHTAVLRALCRAVFLLLDIEIRRRAARTEPVRNEDQEHLARLLKDMLE